MDFRWNDWNIAHIGGHGVSPEEAEGVVNGAARPYPEARGDGKWRVVGQGVGGRFVQVVYLLDTDATVYVIHAMPLSPRDKRRHRRRTR